MAYLESVDELWIGSEIPPPQEPTQTFMSGLKGQTVSFPYQCSGTNSNKEHSRLVLKTNMAFPDSTAWGYHLSVSFPMPKGQSRPGLPVQELCTVSPKCMKVYSTACTLLPGRSKRHGLWLSKPGWDPILVGELTTHCRTYFSEDWDVHWGYGISTHSPIC